MCKASSLNDKIFTPSSVLRRHSIDWRKGVRHLDSLGC
ncbi:hypothetical protein BSM4216_2863 [Bacillus smithii]|nr:hypothetical protein BSM4216_2863 [Bacillus smithii]